MNTPKVVHEAFDDHEVVIINLDTGSYYSLDKVGADIWNLIESGASVSEIIQEFTRRYEPNGINIEDAVSLFIQELSHEQLIVAHSRERLAEAQLEGATVNPRPHFQAPILQKYTDMQDLLLLDPIHEVDETGWPKLKEDS
jgi:hypothetical protein